MITDKEFRQLLEKTEIRKYRNANEAWTLSAIYPLSLAEPTKMKGLSVSGVPQESWAKSKKTVTRKIYEKLARGWGFYGDVTPFIK